MKNYKDTKALTLIALIVTIITLLILAGSTAALIFGDNGLINKTLLAKDETKAAEIRDKNKMGEIEDIISGNSSSGGSESEDIEFKSDPNTPLEFNGGADDVIAIDNIKLFSAENINKDFIIELTLPDQIDGNNKNQAVLLNSKDETQTNVWPGFVVRVIVTDTNRYIALAGTYGKISPVNITQYQGKKLTIEREGGVIYYKLNNSSRKKFMDNPTSPFDTPVTLGGILIGNEITQKYYTGTIPSVSIKLFGNNNQQQNEIIPNNVIETDAYLNTGIKLFDETNWGKDFEVSFEIDTFGKNSNMATLFNSIHEEDPWPGVLVRYESDSLYLQAKNTDKVRKQMDVNDINKITIKRKNNTLSYSKNNEAEEFVIDCSTVPKHNTPVSFGSSLTTKLAPQRPFAGTLKNMTITLEGKTIFSRSSKTFSGKIN